MEEPESERMVRPIVIEREWKDLSNLQISSETDEGSGRYGHSKKGMAGPQRSHHDFELESNLKNNNNNNL